MGAGTTAQVEKQEAAFREKDISALPEIVLCNAGRSMNESLHRVMPKEDRYLDQKKNFIEVCCKIT